jgi:protein-S-isoprenylcysteine O-methyltransferase Ste14
MMIKGKKKSIGQEWTANNIILSALLTILGIVCFPVNPLVLTGVLTTHHDDTAFAVGWVAWAFGMALVLAPMVVFPRRGGVEKGRSFVHTTRLVDTGIYGVVRHPQYLGGVFSIFLTTLLWYPHWLFAMLGLVGSFVVYLACVEEDRRLVRKFGNDYRKYMRKVPGMNIFLGIARSVQSR